MRTLALVRFALCMSLASTMLAGCGGSQLPIAAPGAMPQSRTIAAHTDRSGSWMLPEAKGEDLLYVSDAGSKVVDIYSYPKGVKVGQLTGFAGPGGLCVNRAGDVFVTNRTISGDSNIIEFSHGDKSPIHTLHDPGMEPSGCAVSPMTGDLAVTNYCRVSASGCDGHGNILLYPNASGSPKRYVDRSVNAFYFCGYDNRGTLYADASGRRNGFFDLLKLPKGGHAFVDIQIDFDSSGSGIANPGAVQWDGKLLAIGDEQVEFLKPLVYRVDPANGHVAATITLRRSEFVQQFFIYDSVLLAPNEFSKSGRLHGEIQFYNYPKGGAPTRIIDDGSQPAGAVVSPSARHDR
jgi:hypothetical protein